MPICIKCGGQIAEGVRFCPNCGAKVVVPKPPKAREAREIGEGRFGAPDLLSLIGALALLVGPFLTWGEQEVTGFPAQGLEVVQGIILYVMGALCLAAVVIARNLGHVSGLVYFVLALAAGAIVGHFVYTTFDADIDWGYVAEGFYVAGAGAVLVLLGGIAKLLTKTS